MNKLMIALAAVTVASPAMAFQGQVLGAPQFSGNGYANQGQCTSALAHVRNEQRRNPETRGGSPYNEMSGSDYNRASRDTTRCELRNGRWYVVYYHPAG
ncbi:hypothetical protein [Allosphingosinicella sp.]|jgi:hypothetical protein|uniref:hypothetical protein n=1 Tax=Allosphingosinicella sp. TaxID=2823234 RepID=UPI002EE3BC06